MRNEARMVRTTDEVNCVLSKAGGPHRVSAGARQTSQTLSQTQALGQKETLLSHGAQHFLLSARDWLCGGRGGAVLSPGGRAQGEGSTWD